MDQNFRLIKMADGQVAQALLERLWPFVRLQEGQIIDELKNLYRMGDTNPSKIFAKLGELVALDNLRESLNQKVNQGARAQKELQRET